MAEPISIGRFSELSGLSQKAIRLYCSLGLLLPARVDAFTGYRYFDPEQVGRAQTIARLRGAGVSLNEIAAFLEQPGAARIEEWEQALEAEVARRRENLQAVRRVLAGDTDTPPPVGQEELAMSDEDHGHSHDHGPRHFGAAAPVLRVPDVVAAAEYYRDKLGFEINFIWGEPPQYATTGRGDVAVHFTKSNGQRPPRPDNVSDIYVFVSDIDDICAELTERGARVVAELQTWPYGMREFAVEDDFGYRLCFGEGVEADT